MRPRNGLNTGSFGTDGFGGGFDWEASHTGTMTVTNCFIHDNAITDGRGAGITATNTGGGTGNFTMSNSTVSHNTVNRPDPVHDLGTGGGIFFGSATDPSALWKFSSRAISVRETASAVPLRVCTSWLFPSSLNLIPSRRAW